MKQTEKKQINETLTELISLGSTAQEKIDEIVDRITELAWRAKWD